MKKIKIDGFKIGEIVKITSYNPPVEAKILDMYEIDPMTINDTRLKNLYPKGVPMFEVSMNGGKILSFVKDVVSK
jgi:predicted glycosyltransferase